jgi:plasmid replication initiation protein
MTKEVDRRESVKVVTSNELITAAGPEKLSLQARKLLYVAISQCRKTDRDFYGFELTAKDFADLMGVSVKAVYKESDKVTNELMSGFVRIQTKKDNYRKYSLFSYCDYSKGVLSFKLNPDMTGFLLDLKRDFSQPLLEDFLHMKSEMSMAIWHYMQKQMHSKKPRIGSAIEFTCELQIIREITGTTDTFNRISDFKRYVWDKAIREIKDNCGVNVEYTAIKKGRKIIAFECIAKSSMDTLISPEIRAKVEAGKRRIAAEQQKRGIRSVSTEPEELPLPEPQPRHSRPLTQMEREQYQTENAEQLDFFKLLEKQQ